MPASGCEALGNGVTGLAVSDGLGHARAHSVLVLLLLLVPMFQSSQ